MERNTPYSLHYDKRKNIIRDSIFVVLGAFLQALGYAVFIAPASIIPGGVYGIAIALNHLSQGLFSFFPNGLPIGITALFFNVPLFLLAMKKLGLSSGGKTVATFLLISLFTDLISGYMGNKPLVEDDMLLASVYGGTILGLGVFMTFKAGSTSAGTDVLARIIAKGTNKRISEIILIVDSLVVAFGLLVFADWKVPLYSLITIFVYSWAIGLLQPENPNKAVVIVSTNPLALRDVIINELKLRGTFLHGQGFYEGVERDIIFLIVERKHMTRLKKLVLETDPNAFISTTNATNDTIPKII